MQIKSVKHSAALLIDVDRLKEAGCGR